MNETLAAAASAAAQTSGAAQSGAGSISISINSNSGLGSEKKNEKLDKLKKQQKSQEKFMKAKGIKALADAVLPSVKLIRGAMCVICMDPDAPLDTLWDAAAGKP